MIKSQTAGIVLLVALVLEFIPIPYFGSLARVSQVVILATAILLVMKRDYN